MYIDPEIIIRFDHVTYRDANYYLHDLCYDIPMGQNVCFFGPEYSGIDVLSSLILGMKLEYEGHVFYKGQSVQNMNYIELLLHKKDIGYVKSDYGLISNMSVEQNIALPMEYHSRLPWPEIRAKIRKLIDELNLDHCRSLRPMTLSHSESLRASYAQSIIMEPELLIMDHAFESQSPVNIHSFMNHLRAWSHRLDKSIFFITYEPEKFVDLADIFIMLFNGRIVYQGSRSDYIGTENPYVRQFKTGSEKGPMVIL